MPDEFGGQEVQQDEFGGELVDETAPAAPVAAQGPAPFPPKITLSPYEKLIAEGQTDLGPYGEGPFARERTGAGAEGIIAARSPLGLATEIASIPAVAGAQALTAVGRQIRQLVSPTTYLPEEEQAKLRPFVISRGGELRPQTLEEMAQRDALQAGKPLLPVQGTQLQPEGSEFERMLSSLSTPESILMLAGGGASKLAGAVFLGSMAPGILQDVTAVASGAGTETEKRDRINALLLPVILGLRAAKPGAAEPTGVETEMGPLVLTGGEIPGLPRGATPVRPTAGPEVLGPQPPRRLRTPGAVVPITEAETQRQVPILREIRDRDLRTKEQIQKAFPQLKREEAGELRRLAWGTAGEFGVEVAPTIPRPTPMPPLTERTFEEVDKEVQRQEQARTEAINDIGRQQRRSQIEQNIIFWERELDFALKRNDGRAQDEAIKKLMQFRQEYEGIPPVKQIAPKPPIARAPSAAFRPEVPGTPAEPREDVASVIRRKNIRTRSELLDEFPAMRQNPGAREQAGRILRQVWGTEAPPTPPPPEEPPAPAAAPVEPPPTPPAAPAAAPETPPAPPVEPELQTDLKNVKAGAPFNHPQFGEIWIDKVTPTHVSFTGFPKETATGTKLSKVKISREEFESGKIGPPPRGVPTKAAATALETPVAPKLYPPETIEGTIIAGKTLGEWEAVKDPSQLPRGNARAELARYLAVPNQPGRILQALGNKKRTREIHAPPVAPEAVTPVAPEAPAAPTPAVEPAAAPTPTSPATPAPAAPGAHPLDALLPEGVKGKGKVTPAGVYVTPGLTKKQFDQLVMDADKAGYDTTGYTQKGKGPVYGEFVAKPSPTEREVQQRLSRIGRLEAIMEMDPNQAEAARAEIDRLNGEIDSLRKGQAPVEVTAPAASAAVEAAAPAPEEASNEARIAELKRQLAKEQKALDKNIAKMGTMVPPPIVSEITRKISTRMARIQDEIDALEKPATTPAPELPAAPAPAPAAPAPAAAPEQATMPVAAAAPEAAPAALKLTDAQMEAMSQEVTRLSRVEQELEARYQALIKERDKLPATGAEKRRGEIATEVSQILADKSDVNKTLRPMEGQVFDYRWAKETARFRGQPEAEPSEPKITAKVLKAQKSNLLGQVDDALKAAPEEGTDKVTFSVPGDGDFSIVNNKPKLGEFRDIVAKFFPGAVEASKAKIGGTKVSTTKTGKPTSLPKVSEPTAADLPKIVGEFTSEDPNRFPIQTSYADGKQLVATDGRQLIRIVGPGLPGTVNNPARLNPDGTPNADATEASYPNFNQVRPSKPTLVKAGADTGELWKIARQAQVFKDSFGDKANNALNLFLNPDGTFAVRNTQAGGEVFEHNVQKGAYDLGAVNVDYFAGMMSAARRLGNEKIDFYVQGETGPVMAVGKNHEHILMPMRVSDRSEVRPRPSRIPASLVGVKTYPIPEEFEAPKNAVGGAPSKGPGAAAAAEFEETTPPDQTVIGLSAGNPVWNRMVRQYQNFTAGVKQLGARRLTRREFQQLLNFADNFPRMAGQEAGNSIRLRTANIPEQNAITALMQALKMSGEGLSQEDAARLGDLEFAGDPIGYLRSKQTDLETFAQQMLNEGKRLEAGAAIDLANAMKLARARYNQLRPVAILARQKFDRQFQRERLAGIDTDYERWYVPQRHDLDLLTSADRPIVLGSARGSGMGTGFKKAKVYEDYASAIEAGFVPRTLSIADLLEHRVAQGERLIVRKSFFNGLKSRLDPVDGKAIVTSVPRRIITRPDGSFDVQETIPIGYSRQEVIPGVNVAVHNGYARMISALTGRSAIADSATISTLQNIAAFEKHIGLALDTFHASRTLQTEFMLTHKLSLGARQRLGRALVEYSLQDLDAAVSKGEITQEMADYIRTPVPVEVNGRTISLTPKAMLNIGIKSGVNVARFADVIYRDWLREIPVTGAVNRWVFDKMTRSAIAHGFISEFQRVAKSHPEWTARQVGLNVARDINVLFGNLQKESIFRNPTLRAINQIVFLAPQWVESLARREGRAVLQLGQAGKEVLFGRPLGLPERVMTETGETTIQRYTHVPRLGTVGRAMGTGVASYLVATQLLNLITRGHLTFSNEEEGHKLDAWIPGGTKGFFISPLSVFGEITHDIIRYAQSQPDFASALARIGANKLGNLGRAIGVMALGRDALTGEKLIGTSRRAWTAALQAVPVPITASAGLKTLGAMAGVTSPPPPGGLQRQLTASLGFKTEPVPSAQNQIYAIADRWKLSQGPKLAAQVQQRLKEEFGPSRYGSLRTALLREDITGARKAYQALRDEGATPQTIRQTIERPHPFAGSAALERRFHSSLTPQQKELYRKAIEEREEMKRRFRRMLSTR